MITEKLPQYKLEIASSPENIVQLEPYLEDLRSEFNISEDIYGNIIVVLTEAVNNSIIHGNKCDALKKVDVSFTKKDNSLIFTIKDDGEGFDHNILPDPTSPENIENPSGRGVFLMKHLSDLIIFSNHGRTIEVHFRI